MKYEKVGAKHPQLRHEYKVYRLMTNCPGFCTVSHVYSTESINFFINIYETNSFYIYF